MGLTCTLRVPAAAQRTTKLYSGKVSQKFMGWNPSEMTLNIRCTTEGCTTEGHLGAHRLLLMFVDIECRCSTANRQHHPASVQWERVEEWLQYLTSLGVALQIGDAAFRMLVAMTRKAPRRPKRRSCAFRPPSPPSYLAAALTMTMHLNSNNDVTRTSDENEGSIIMSLISQLRWVLHIRVLYGRSSLMISS